MLKCRSSFEVIVGTGNEINRLSRKLEIRGLKNASYKRIPEKKEFSVLKIYNDGEFLVSGEYKDLILALTNGGFRTSSVSLEDDVRTPRQVIKMYGALIRKGSPLADKYWHWKSKVLK